MSTVPLLPTKRFSRSDVRRMIDAGVFDGQRYELIHGELIDKMGQNPRHAYAVRLVLSWLAQLFRIEQIQVQLPIEVASEDQERSCPEPDVAVVAEAKAAYQVRHPRGNELLLAVEVADSSSQFDLTVKAGLYARSGVPEYWVLDIANRVLVVHRHVESGQYRDVVRRGEEEAISLESTSDRTIVISNLMPAK